MFLLCLLLVSSILVTYGNPITPANRIVGGIEAPLGYAPHMAALINSNAYRDNLICGGSIVSKTHILTAAHCITPFIDVTGVLVPTFRSRIGSNDWQRGGIIGVFKKYHIHPQWDENAIKYDVGILVLEHELKYNEKISPIGLNFEWMGGDEDGYVTGWGRMGPSTDGIAINLAPLPDDLQLLYLKTITHKQCVELMRNVDGWTETFPNLDPEIEICTYHSFGHGVCNGDSGSPLVHLDSGLQCGIVSWGYPCARGVPDVFTRLSGVKHFILSVLK